MGYPANIMVGGSGVSAPMSQYQQTPEVPSPGGSLVGVEAKVIDGTPLRVATGILLFVGALAGFRWAGYKFSVTVG